MVWTRSPAKGAVLEEGVDLCCRLAAAGALREEAGDGGTVGCSSRARLVGMLYDMRERYGMMDLIPETLLLKSELKVALLK